VKQRQQSSVLSHIEKKPKMFVFSHDLSRPSAGQFFSHKIPRRAFAILDHPRREGNGQMCKGLLHVLQVRAGLALYLGAGAASFALETYST